jgi:hypothetical protein
MRELLARLGQCSWAERLPTPDNPLHDRREIARSGVNEQQVRRLDEMDEQQAHRFLAELLSNLSPEEEHAVRHEDYVMEMPRSGERFRGQENMRAFQEAYPTSPSSVRLRRVLVERVLVKEGLWVVEGVADYGGGQVLNVVLILELRDGKMWRDRWHFAEPFEAPEWRTQWVERMETGAPPR